MIGIYKITTPFKEIYIGQSIDLERRIKSHKNKEARNFKIQSSIKKYGIESHIFEIVQECSINDLDIIEEYWIKKLCKNNIMINKAKVDFIYNPIIEESIPKDIENKIVTRFKIYDKIVCLNDGLLYQLEHLQANRTKVFRKLTYNEKRDAYYINGQLVTRKRLNNLAIK